jgi:hypothetical protein
MENMYSKTWSTFLFTYIKSERENRKMEKEIHVEKGMRYAYIERPKEGDKYRERERQRET